MTRLSGIVALALSLAAVASCTLGFDRIFLPDQGVEDAKVILQGMKSVPLRQGDAPVDIQPE